MINVELRYFVCESNGKLAHCEPQEPDLSECVVPSSLLRGGRRGDWECVFSWLLDGLFDSRGQRGRGVA